MLSPHCLTADCAVRASFLRAATRACNHNVSRPGVLHEPIAIKPTSSIFLSIVRICSAAAIWNSRAWEFAHPYDPISRAGRTYCGLYGYHQRHVRGPAPQSTWSPRWRYWKSETPGKNRPGHADRIGQRDCERNAKICKEWKGHNTDFFWEDSGTLVFTSMSLCIVDAQ